MKTPIRFFAMLFGSLLLAAGSDHARASAFGPPPADNVNIDVSANSIGTNSTATLTVTVTRRNGTPETDGTLISATVSPPSIGSIAGSGSSGVGSSSSALSGGVASFVFIANNTPGTATITISVPPVNGHPTTVTSKVTITVVQGDGNNPSLKVTPSTVTLPQNLVGAGPAFGSPYMAEVQVEWRGLISGQLINGKISVATSPVGSIAFSTLDDPTTPWTGETKTPPTAEGNEFLTELGSGPVNVTAGIGTIFIHSGATTGPATLTITAVDPETNRTISSQIAVNVITPPGANLPTSVTLSQDAGGVYINGSNGPQSKIVTATVTNIYGTPAIADPAHPGVDNVQFDIVGPSGTDAKLFGVSASGVPQIGTSVKTVTGSGGASVYFVAGNVQGPVQIRATVDGYDGDVGNGVTIPVTATTTVVVSDGQLYSLTITSPMVNAIAVNGITASSSTSGSSTTPTQPDATYSLTVSAIATDRQGNPVLPGTPIRFGLIDTPQTPDFTSSCGIGAFQICGVHGNPQPGTMSFTAPDGRFHSAGGGAGPGDTLVVFGKQWKGAPAGNDDLESAQLISGIVDDTRLFTIFPFNRNDTTGTSVASGPVLPYVIGRATIGNINSPVATDSSGAATVTGTATTKLNYPSSQLNRSVVIYAQGTGTDTVAGGTRTVTDAIVTVYPAVADLIVSASPNPIPGNTSVSVNVCVTDAQHVPVPGLRFGFSFSDLGVGSGTVVGVDGPASAGLTHDQTGPDGCVVANVSTQGIAGSSSGGGGGGGSSSGTPTLTFIAPGYSAGSSGSVAIPINANGDLILLVSPSALRGNGGNVGLTLRSSNGKAVSGVQLTGTCTGNTVSLQSGPGTTDVNGQTSATITADLDAYGKVNTGNCTFTTATGSPTATVTLTGADLCVNDPNNAACSTSGGTGGGTGNTVNITVDASASPAVPSGCTSNCTATVKATISGGTAVFSPGGTNTVTCYGTPGQTASVCSLTVPTGVASINLTATPATGGAFGAWSNTCTGTTPSTTLTIAGTTNCTATFH